MIQNVKPNVSAPANKASIIEKDQIRKGIPLVNKYFLFFLSGFLGISFWTFTASAQTVVFATDWKAQAEHGGFYQALALGFYQDEGLSVTLRPGGPQIDNPRLIAAGALDIAMASNSFQPFTLKAAGVDVKVVMAAFQKDPQVLMVHESNPIKSFADLKDRPIFVASSAISTFWPWLKARFDLKDSQIRKYTYSIAPWLVNKNTALEGYLSSEPYSARQAGASPQTVLFADQGYSGYAAMVMVSDRYLKENPDIVRRFVRASLKGWQSYMFDDPTPGNKLIMADNPEMTEDLLIYAHKTMLDNEITGSRRNIGQMSADRWATFYDEMSNLGAVAKGLDPKDVYTLEFMPPPVKP